MKITFARTGNVYLNAGIVGIAVTLDQYDIWRQKTEPVTEELPQHTWGWEGNALQVSAEEPLKLLELIYKVMGQQYYDTSTMDALAKMTNFWYEPDTDEFHPFPKMKTYGFGGLLTNDAAGKTPREENTIRRKAIKPGDAFGQMLEQKYIALFEEKGLKLGQQLYINEPYAKITRLKLEEADIAPGKLSCPITGEKFKRLQPAISVSPTTSGLKNFLPGLSSKGDKIGWKAMFMIRFSPVLALYRYAAGLEQPNPSKLRPYRLTSFATFGITRIETRPKRLGPNSDGRTSFATSGITRIETNRLAAGVVTVPPFFCYFRDSSHPFVVKIVDPILPPPLILSKGKNVA